MSTMPILAAVLILAASPAQKTAAEGDDRFLTLCYHDVVSKRGADALAVEEAALVAQLEFLRGQGAHFLTVDELLAARKGARKLPPKSVLLTFDDGCKSFHTKVLPLLKLYKIPAVLSVITAWTAETTGADCADGVMTWEEIAETARSGLVEIASHTHDSHRGGLINPLGSTSPMASMRLFDSKKGRYETEQEYRKRLARDLGLSAKLIRTRLGITPRVLTWPYGAYSGIAVEEAQRAEYPVLLTLRDDIEGGIGRLSDLSVVPRRMLMGHPSIEEFADGYWAGGPQATLVPAPPTQRGVHVDLDLFYDPDPRVLRSNLERFFKRIDDLGPSTVYLQAFSDDAGTGNISSVYFPNRVLPMKADLFSFVARSLTEREIRVYAWMPTLSLVLPDAAQTEALLVRERHEGKIRPTRNDYRRLSPFSPQARALTAQLFEDLALSSTIDGIIFQDDAFLDEEEDFHPAALAAAARLGIDPRRLEPGQKETWTALKTRALIDWTDALMEKVRRHRPHAQSARTVYAPVLVEPESERWFAQNYAASLKAYDEVVVMAYPLMEHVKTAQPWLQRLVEVACAEPGGLDKTIFKIQTVDWDRDDECVPPDTVVLWLRTLVGAGARHLAYYPDNLYEDCPRRAWIRDFIRTDDSPLPLEPPDETDTPAPEARGGR